MLHVIARDVCRVHWLDDLFALRKGNVEKSDGVGEDGVGALVLT